MNLTSIFKDKLCCAPVVDCSSILLHIHLVEMPSAKTKRALNKLYYEANADKINTRNKENRKQYAYAKNLDKRTKCKPIIKGRCQLMQYIIDPDKKKSASRAYSV